MAIEKQFPKSSTDVIYIALSLMQKWSIKLKEGDQKTVVTFSETVLSWLKTFTPSPILLTDVVEL